MFVQEKGEFSAHALLQCKNGAAIARAHNQVMRRRSPASLAADTIQLC
jgi:hypothetical protein